MTRTQRHSVHLISPDKTFYVTSIHDGGVTVENQSALVKSWNCAQEVKGLHVPLTPAVKAENFMDLTTLRVTLIITYLRRNLFFPPIKVAFCLTFGEVGGQMILQPHQQRPQPCFLFLSFRNIKEVFGPTFGNLKSNRDSVCNTVSYVKDNVCNTKNTEQLVR